MTAATTEDRRTDLQSLLELPADDLDRLFRDSKPGPVPRGRADGLFILLPGTPLTRPLARFIETVLWKGKRVDAARGRLVNRVLPFGLEAVPAQIYHETSRFDGRPCLTLDYSRTSLIARGVRDEIREVAPGIYLGLVYLLGRRAGRFALRFPGLEDPTPSAA